MKKFLYKSADETNDEASKFWIIGIEGSRHRIQIGELGDIGTSQSQAFNSKEECLKNFVELVKEQKENGYEEIREEAFQKIIDKGFRPRIRFSFDSGSTKTPMGWCEQYKHVEIADYISLKESN